MQITEHFSYEEAACKCGCVMPPNVRQEVELTAQWAELIRKQLGNLPMNINSWYRCESYNKLVGGKPNSQHILGKAIDFTVKSLSPFALQNAILQTNMYPALIKGLGRYPGFTHIDRRDGFATQWDINTA